MSVSPFPPRYVRRSLPLPGVGRKSVHAAALRYDPVMPTPVTLSDDDYRLVADGGCDGESWLAPDGSLRWTNPAMARITGYSQAECMAMPRYPWPLVFAEDRTSFELFDHSVGERLPGSNLPFRLLRKDGTMIWVTASWRPMRDGVEYRGIRLSLRDASAGLHNRYLDHFRPVTVEVQNDVLPIAGDLQRVHRLVTERAARALGVARVGVWLFDEDGGNLVCASRFSRLDNAHIAGASIAMSTCPRYRTAISGNQLVVATDAVNDPVTSELAESYLRPLGIASLLDAPIVRDGRTIGVLCHEHVGKPRTWYETELTFVEGLADVLTLALDLAERHRLAERNRMLASIIEALPDPVVTVSLEGSPVYLNRAALQANEPRADNGIVEFDVAPAERSYSPEAWAHRNAVVVPAAIRDGSWSGEVRLLARQGEEIPVWQTMVSHADAAGAVRYLTSILRDLRPQKRIELELQKLNAELESRVRDRTRRLEEANGSLKAFAFSVAHDLNAPLRGIAGFARALQDDYAPQLPGDAPRFVAHILGATKRMQRLVTDLLAHSKLASRDLSLVRFSVGDELARILSERQPDIDERHIAVHARVGDVQIEADPACFGQLLRNLIDNAIKYTQLVSRPELRIDVEQDDTSTRITVTDNGIGFDMRFHDRIFGLFERLHTEEQFPGTGVGLALAAKAAERMGGRIWARSSPGQGAAFTFELPRT
jgi:PAS domain S-box-containing protein